jgi:hypothetical protein
VAADDECSLAVVFKRHQRLCYYLVFQLLERESIELAHAVSRAERRVHNYPVKLTFHIGIELKACVVVGDGEAQSLQVLRAGPGVQLVGDNFLRLGYAGDQHAVSCGGLVNCQRALFIHPEVALHEIRKRRRRAVLLQGHALGVALRETGL